MARLGTCHPMWSASHKSLDKFNLRDVQCLQLDINQTVEAEIKTVCAHYRESGEAENRAEMQAVKWTAEGMVKGDFDAEYSMT